jgi:Fe-S-cluster containining protein
MSAWWSNGVRFGCQPQCGKCCDQPGGVVFLTKSDVNRMANFHDLSFDEFITQHCTRSMNGRVILKSNEKSGVCIFLNETKQCSIYSVRPQQCKAFPWWAENLRSEHKWIETKMLCPGIDADDAIIIDGKTIRMHVLADREASKGFRI